MITSFKLRLAVLAVGLAEVGAGEPDDVGLRQTVVVDRFDVLVDDGHGMAGGRQRREQRCK